MQTTDAASNTAFDSALRQGRSDTSFISRLIGHDNRLLELQAVLDTVAAGPETYQGRKDAKLRDVIGSENRGDDFSSGFMPRKNWMRFRWASVYSLMSAGELSDPVVLIEVGQRYFVRDGHHRVSAAKSLEIEFISAEVYVCKLPFRLPPNLDRNGLSLLKAKNSFHIRTGIFDIISDSHFYVACPETWKFLEKEILVYNRAGFKRRFGRDPETDAEQIRLWYNENYTNIIDYVKRNSLTYLFPGKRETDIVAEIIKLWNTFDEPAKVWIGDLYRIFLEQQRRKKLLLSIPHFFIRHFHYMLMSPEREYRFFALISQIEDQVPDFCPLVRQKGVYRYLYHQLIHWYPPVLKQELGRAPYIHELTKSWHERFYRPVRMEAKKRYPESQTRQAGFYLGFSRKFFNTVTAVWKNSESSQSLTLEQALSQYRT